MNRQWAGFLLLAAILALELAFWVWCLPPNHDEGWILHAADLVGDGLKPYRDFGFTQGPWVPQLFHGASALPGAGLVEGRMISACAGLIAVALVADSLRIRAGSSVALLMLGLMVVDLFLMAQFCLVKTYGVSALGVAAAVWLQIRTETGSDRIRVFGEFLAGLALASTAFGIRLSLVAVVCVWMLGAFRRGLAPGAGAALGVLMAVVWLVVGGGWLPAETAWWNLIAVHLGPWFQDGELRVWWMLGEWISMLVYTALTLVVWLGVGIWVARTAPTPVRWMSSGTLPLGWMILAAVLAHLLPGGRHAEYVVVVWPCIVVLAGSWAQHGAGVRGVVWGCFGGLAIVHCALCWVRLGPLVSLSGPAENTRAVASALRADLSSAERVLTFHPLVAVEANSRLVRGLEMGPFSLLPESQDRYRRITPEEVIAAVTRPDTGAVVLSERDFIHDAYNREMEPARVEGWRVGMAEAAERRFGAPRIFPDVGQFGEEVRVYSDKSGLGP